MASSARKIESNELELDGLERPARRGAPKRRKEREPLKVVAFERKESHAPRILRVTRRLLGENRTFEDEVRSFPAQLLATLPRPTTLRLQIPGLDRVVAVATSADRAMMERESGALVFDAMEWSAIVAAAEADRLWPADLREICGRKTKAPVFALDLEAALGGARIGASPGWSIGRVLDRVGAQLLSAEC
jgi:hypothetical protein